MSRFRSPNHLRFHGQYSQTMGSGRWKMYDDFDSSQEVGSGSRYSSYGIQFRKCQFRWQQVSFPNPFTAKKRQKLRSSIKKWKCPEGIFVNNFTGHEAIINTLSLNSEGVLFSGADNGTLTMWDYKTGLPFQHLKDIPQPGSLDAEAVSHHTVIAMCR